MKKFSVERSRVLLYNRYVLIFIFILALVNVIQLATIGDYFTVSLFVLVGFLTTYFSKNMIVVLTVAMVFANLVKYGTDLANPWVYEGFDNHDNHDNKKKEPMTKKDKTSKIEEMVAENKKKQENLENGKDADADADDDDEDTEEEFSGKKSKKQQKIEKDALDDLRHEMKLGFKRLNQNIDSVGMSNLFS
jgi:hypothetical protein